MVLSDLGAEVIKIERPKVGDIARGNGPHVNGVSTYFVSLNRGKKSIVINLATPSGKELFLKLVKHAARVGAELGADIVKVPYTGSPETFREVVEGCFVPVVIAGGEKMETDQDVLEMVEGSVKAGGAGGSAADGTGAVPAATTASRPRNVGAILTTLPLSFASPGSP
jgi:hypothetical protein